mmetsp:Transcript_7651/g.23323  ORF Transcript_7651/g.23323 Transcript_7651/m.23323 type:complete len:368 (-) Transcript_7651:520-1623(-)
MAAQRLHERARVSPRRRACRGGRRPCTIGATRSLSSTANLGLVALPEMRVGGAIRLRCKPLTLHFFARLPPEGFVGLITERNAHRLAQCHARICDGGHSGSSSVGVHAGNDSAQRLTSRKRHVLIDVRKVCKQSAAGRGGQRICLAAATKVRHRQAALAVDERAVSEHAGRELVQVGRTWVLASIGHELAAHVRLRLKVGVGYARGTKRPDEHRVKRRVVQHALEAVTTRRKRHNLCGRALTTLLRLLNLSQRRAFRRGTLEYILFHARRRGIPFDEAQSLLHDGHLVVGGHDHAQRVYRVHGRVDGLLRERIHLRALLLPVPVQHAPARQVRVVQLVPRQVPVNAAAEHTPGITELEPVHALVVLV